MLGAYFGSTKIVQGAAGLGQDDPMTAYSDGVVGGGQYGETYPGLLMSYQDGSLGEAPLQAYADGSVGGRSENPDMPGPIVAYEEGVLGPRFHGQQYALPNGNGGGGSSGGGGGGGGGGSDTMADMPAPVFSYQDGVFGGRGATCGLGEESHPNTYDSDTPVMAYHEGILGPHYEGMSTFGPLQSFHDGSLGADAPTAVSTPVLDLGDAATLAEVKSLIGQSSAVALSAEGQKAYTVDFYTSGIWEPSASALWQATLSAIPAFSGKDVSVIDGNQAFPNGLAIAYLYGVYAAPTASAPGPAQAAQNFPLITAWFLGKGTQVSAPYFSIAAKTKGLRGGAAEAGMSMGTMAMWGLGAAALLGVALVFSKKKR